MKLEEFRALPNWKKLQCALDDLKTCARRTSKFRIRMCYGWYQLNGGFCVVCHAGACMALSLSEVSGKIRTSDGRLLPCHFDPDESNFLMSINLFRRGRFGAACNRLGISYEHFILRLKHRELNMPEYHENRRKYYEAWRDIITAVKYVEGMRNAN